MSGDLQAVEPAVAPTAAPLETASRQAVASSAADLGEAAAHGVRWAWISRPVIELVQLGSIVILARLIVPAEFGRYAVALIAQEAAYLIAAGGLSSALVQRKTVRREHLQTGMALGLMMGIGLAVLMLVAATVIVGPLFGPRTAVLVRLLSPLCLISSMCTVPLATLRRRMAFRRLSEIEMLAAVIRVGVCIALALLGLGGEALVLGVVAGALTLLIGASISAPPPPPRLDRRAARELLDYGLPASLAAVSWVGFSNVDYAIIGARLGPLQTGYYFRAYTLAVEYQGKVSLVMGQVGFPVLARAPTAHELANLYRRMVRLLTITIFPLLALLAIGAPVVVPFLFGPRWDSAVVPVQILVVGGAATLVINAAGTVLMAKGRAHALLGYGVGHFLSYGLTVFLVVPLGIVAVAVAAAVVHTAFLLVAYVLIIGRHSKPLRRLWGDIAPASLSCLGLVAVALPFGILLTAAHVPPVAWLLSLGAVAIPAYLLTLRVCFPSDWRAQRAAVARVLPPLARLTQATRRLATATVRPSA